MPHDRGVPCDPVAVRVTHGDRRYLCGSLRPMPDVPVLRPAALAVLPAGYQALFDAAVGALVADDRVRALWVHGSVGRGEADPSSDLDLILAVADDAFDDLWATLARAAGRPSPRPCSPGRSRGSRASSTP